VPYAYLAVSVVGFVAVALSYRPIRREPLTIVSFVLASWTSELALQNIVWQMLATALFVAFGALDGWAGWLGLVFAVAGWIGLLGLGIAGLRAADVTAAALSEVRSSSFPVPAKPTDPTWGRWWRVTRAIPMKSRAVQVTRNVDYWGDGRPRHRLDVYRSRLVPREKAPVMVYVHGGGWVIGDKREQGKPMMFELVARGWVCVAINYRLSPKAVWPDHIVDVKRALAWVREHVADYGGDPGFIAISGGSAGGHLCALAALTAGDPVFQPGFEDADTSVQACVPFYGVMDLTSSPDGSAVFGPGMVEMLEKTVMKVKEADDPEVFRAASPTYRVHPGAPPFFVLQGRNDTLVPVQMARTFVERLRGVSGSPVAYAELPLAQHAFDVVASLRCQATTSAVGDFLEAARAAHAAGRPAAMDVTAIRNISDIESPR
jgi:acetyl esterase/lipase